MEQVRIGHMTYDEMQEFKASIIAEVRDTIRAELDERLYEPVFLNMKGLSDKIGIGVTTLHRLKNEGVIKQTNSEIEKGYFLPDIIKQLREHDEKMLQKFTRK